METQEKGDDVVSTKETNEGEEEKISHRNGIRRSKKRIGVEVRGIRTS